MASTFHLDKASANAPAFKGDIVALDMGAQRLKAVVIGGGSGAPISIRVLLEMGFETSVVVAMADDGGSTGVLRAREGATAPGDIRKCLAALSAPGKVQLARALQTRFAADCDHAIGNLILAILEKNTGSFKEAIAIVEDLLECRGHVYPSTYSSVYLAARTIGDKVIHGQWAACKSKEALHEIWLESDEELIANPDACQAIMDADLVVLGPGSLFTSILPNVAVPGIAKAIRETQAACIYVGSIADTQGETNGMSSADYIDALERHGLSECVDFALINDPTNWGHETIKPVFQGKVNGFERIGGKSGPAALVLNLADEDTITWHNPAKLAAAIAEVVDRCHLLQR